MMLSTKEFAKELQRMMDEEGLTPEDVHNKTNVHRSTIYGIIAHRNESTQRAVLRKICEGMGWNFKIKGDKITLSKPAVDDDEYLHTLNDEAKKFVKLFNNMSEGFQKQIIDLMRTMEGRSVENEHRGK